MFTGHIDEIYAAYRGSCIANDWGMAAGCMRRGGSRLSPEPAHVDAQILQKN